MSILQIQETKAQRGKMTNPKAQSQQPESLRFYRILSDSQTHGFLFFHSRQQNFHTTSPKIANDARLVLRCN